MLVKSSKIFVFYKNVRSSASIYHIKDVCKSALRSVHNFLSYVTHRLRKSSFQKNAFKVLKAIKSIIMIFFFSNLHRIIYSRAIVCTLRCSRRVCKILLLLSTSCSSLRIPASSAFDGLWTRLRNNRYLGEFYSDRLEIFRGYSWDVVLSYKKLSKKVIFWSC